MDLGIKVKCLEAINQVGISDLTELDYHQKWEMEGSRYSKYHYFTHIFSYAILIFFVLLSSNFAKIYID